MAKIIMDHYATNEYREIWRNGSELDAMKDAQQMARGNRQAAFIVTTDRDRWLIQYGPNDRVKRINWN